VAHQRNEADLVAALARLRAAQIALGGSDDLRVVRALIERQLGPTVKRAVAARALGVSQPALDRWSDSGDIPTVPTPAGRWEVPVPALVDLIAAVAASRARGERFPLAAVLNERRSAAARLDLDQITADLDRATGRRGAEVRGLAYHRALAQRLDDQAVEEARERLAIWQADGKIAEDYADRWAALLERPLPEIARAISRDDEHAHDLRQNSPFAGALTERERQRVLAAVS
jgi:hypothetical protein